MKASQYFNKGIALNQSRLQAFHFFGPYQAPRENLNVHCVIHSAVALWLLGNVDQAQERVNQALKLAHETSHPLTLTSTLFWAARVAQYRREVQTALERAEATLALCVEHEFSQYTAGASILRGWARTMQNWHPSHIDEMRQQMSESETIGSRSSKAYYRLLLTEVLATGGHAEGALCVLAEALDHMQATDEHMFKAEVYRLKGELLLKVGCGARHTELAPDACFQKAIALARNQQAKSLELRAATSLARLWQQQNRYKDAHDVLAPVYHWFTEGFDTADLQEAKRLLAELA